VGYLDRTWFRLRDFSFDRLLELNLILYVNRIFLFQGEKLLTFLDETEKKDKESIKKLKYEKSILVNAFVNRKNKVDVRFEKILNNLI